MNPSVVGDVSHQSVLTSPAGPIASSSVGCDPQSVIPLSSQTGQAVGLLAGQVQLHTHGLHTFNQPVHRSIDHVLPTSDVPGATVVCNGSLGGAGVGSVMSALGSANVSVAQSTDSSIEHHLLTQQHLQQQQVVLGQQIQAAIGWQSALSAPHQLQQGQQVSSVAATPKGLGEFATAPPVEIKLFVGRVPRTFTENDLRPIFEEFAQVLEVAIIKEKSTGVHKGSAFVRLASITEADRAIRELNSIKTLDHALGPLHVRYAEGEVEKLGLSLESVPGQDQAKLFVGSLPKGVTEEEVHRCFSAYGQIDEIFLHKDPSTGSCKGCAFVKFAYKEQALNAIKHLNRQCQFPGAPRQLEVRFAESKKQQQQQVQQVQQVQQGQRVMVANTINLAGAASALQAPPSNINPRQAGHWKEYFTHESRPYYHNEMTGVTQWDKPQDFDAVYSPQSGSGRDVTGPPGANIFVFHIPNEWTQQELVNNFCPFGHIVSAHIATDKTTGRNKGYAFVSFDNISSSVAAVTYMNGFLAGGKRLKVSIKQHEDKYVAHLMPTTAPAAVPTAVMR